MKKQEFEEYLENIRLMKELHPDESVPNLLRRAINMGNESLNRDRDSYLWHSDTMLNECLKTYLKVKGKCQTKK